MPEQQLKLHLKLKLLDIAQLAQFTILSEFQVSSQLFVFSGTLQLELRED